MMKYASPRRLASAKRGEAFDLMSATRVDVCALLRCCDTHKTSPGVTVKCSSTDVPGMRLAVLDGWYEALTYLSTSRPSQTKVSPARRRCRHVMARRHTRLFGPTGRVVADAAIDWVMTDQDGRPVRFPQEFERFVQQVNATFVPNKIPVAAPSGAGIEIAIRRADIDPLGHVNHAAWLEIIEEAVAQVAPTHLEAPRRRIRMEYLAVTADRTARVHILGDAGDDQLRVDVTDTIGSPILRAELSVIGS
jgi:acyl-CoA thioesterase FadM